MSINQSVKNNYIEIPGIHHKGNVPFVFTIINKDSTHFAYIRVLWKPNNTMFVQASYEYDNNADWQFTFSDIQNDNRKCKYID